MSKELGFRSGSDVAPGLLLIWYRLCQYATYPVVGY